MSAKGPTENRYYLAFYNQIFIIDLFNSIVGWLDFIVILIDMFDFVSNSWFDISEYEGR